MSRFDLQSLPKCGAYARTSGKQCTLPAMENGRCHWHGGRTTIQNGLYTKKADAIKKAQSLVIEQMKKNLKELNE